MGIPFESANASRGARHAVTHFPKIDFDQNDHDHFDHHVTAGRKYVGFVSDRYLVRVISQAEVLSRTVMSHGARHAVT